MQLDYPDYLEFPAISNPIVVGLCNFHPPRVLRKLYDPMFKQKKERPSLRARLILQDSQNIRRENYMNLNQVCVWIIGKAKEYLKGISIPVFFLFLYFSYPAFQTGHNSYILESYESNKTAYDYFLRDKILYKTLNFLWITEGIKKVSSVRKKKKIHPLEKKGTSPLGENKGTPPLGQFTVTRVATTKVYV